MSNIGSMERGVTTTVAPAQLGSLHDDFNLSLTGDRIDAQRTVFRLVQNVSGGTLSGCDVLKWSTVGTTVVKTTTGAHVCGAVDNQLGAAAVANNAYFLMAVRGPHHVLSDGAYSANDYLKGMSTAQCDTATIGTDDYFGIAIEAATGADEKKLAFLLCE